MIAKKKFMNLVFSLALVSSSVSAVIEDRSVTFAMKATVVDTSSPFQIKPAESDWPANGLEFSYDDNGYKTPGSLSYLAKSSAAITLRLTGPAVLTHAQSDLATIPINVRSSDDQGGEITLSLSPQNITSGATAVFTPFLFDFDIDMANVTDDTGSIIDTTPVGLEKPIAGNYTGSISLIFESDLI